ncbi:MAG: SEL1-like repeat protein [Verrucomicrobia subdivision 3 bacterium]|nr:SEL1-like repeat protein [Limisphaerales bacterium]
MKIALIILGLCLCLLASCADKDKALSKDFKALKALVEKNDAKAQSALGDKYYTGKGVLKDHVTAYAWWNIAAFSGDADAKKSKGIIAKKMTEEQIAEAQKLSKEMLKKNPKLAK